MGKLKGYSFYDRKAKNYYRKENFHDELYVLCGNIIPKEMKILDLGCGGGYFYYTNMGKYKKYIGVDFSKESILKAKEYCSCDNFIVMDIYNIESSFYNNFDVVVCLEVLEHLEDDMFIVENIPKETPFIFSVPNFNHKSHVRVFKNEKDIRKRYNDLLDIQYIRKIKTLHNNTVFLCYSIR